VAFAVRSGRRSTEERGAVTTAGRASHSRSVSSSNPLTFSKACHVEAIAAVISRRRALPMLQFPLPLNALLLNRRRNGAVDGHLVDLLRSARALEVALQLGDSPARLIEASDFLLRLLWQVSKLVQYSANRTRWLRRRKKVPLAWSRMRGRNRSSRSRICRLSSVKSSRAAPHRMFNRCAGGGVSLRRLSVRQFE
jgi:hypothetical protein